MFPETRSDESTFAVSLKWLSVWTVTSKTIPLGIIETALPPKVLGFESGHVFET
jgi:hypothetical protein